jgi:hypothetical protein
VKTVLSLIPVHEECESEKEHSNKQIWIPKKLLTNTRLSKTKNYAPLKIKNGE